MHKHCEIDWTRCSDVERVKGKQGGVPVLKGTRIPVDQIIEESKLGETADEIAENYEVAPEAVRNIIAFHDKQTLAHA